MYSLINKEGLTMVYNQLVQIAQNHSCKGWGCHECAVEKECWSIHQDVGIHGEIPEHHPIIKITSEKLEKSFHSWVDDLMASQN